MFNKIAPKSKLAIRLLCFNCDKSSLKICVQFSTFLIDRFSIDVRLSYHATEMKIKNDLKDRYANIVLKKKISNIAWWGCGEVCVCV